MGVECMTKKRSVGRNMSAVLEPLNWISLVIDSEHGSADDNKRKRKRRRAPKDRKEETQVEAEQRRFLNNK